VSARELGSGADEGELQELRTSAAEMHATDAVRRLSVGKREVVGMRMI
jgi:hypothetical protein